MLIAICDDESQELEDVKAALAQAAAELCADVEIAAYSSGEALLQAVGNGACPSLTILDIYMEGLDGIAAARRLRERIPGLPVAFLTASREYAVDAFELDALHYLLKPVTNEKVRVLLERFLAQHQQPRPVLTLTSGREERRFPVGRIRYIVSQDRGTVLYLEGQARGYWLGCPFREALAQLAENPDFLQISRSCIVHLNAVLFIGNTDCHMKGGECLTVSRQKRQAVKNSYHDFLFRKMSQAEGDVL